MDSIETLFNSAPPEKNLYFHRETIYYSVEGRKMEVMTISSRDGITDERESIPNDDCPELYPDAKDDPEKRAMKFEPNKKVVIFSARVHPGESPATFMLNGFIDLLTDMRSD